MMPSCGNFQHGRGLRVAGAHGCFLVAVVLLVAPQAALPLSPIARGIGGLCAVLAGIALHPGSLGDESLPPPMRMGLARGMLHDVAGSSRALAMSAARAAVGLGTLVSTSVMPRAVDVLAMRDLGSMLGLLPYVTERALGRLRLPYAPGGAGMGWHGLDICLGLAMEAAVTALGVRAGWWLQGLLDTGPFDRGGAFAWDGMSLALLRRLGGSVVQQCVDEVFAALDERGRDVRLAGCLFRQAAVTLGYYPLMKHPSSLCMVIGLDFTAMLLAQRPWASHAEAFGPGMRNFLLPPADGYAAALAPGMAAVPLFPRAGTPRPYAMPRHEPPLTPPPMPAQILTPSSTGGLPSDSPVSDLPFLGSAPVPASPSENLLHLRLAPDFMPPPRVLPRPQPLNMPIPLRADEKLGRPGRHGLRIRLPARHPDQSLIFFSLDMRPLPPGVRPPSAHGPWHFR